MIYSLDILLSQFRTSLLFHVQFNSVQLLSRIWHFESPRIAALEASLSITNTRSFPKLMSIESVTPSSHLILCHPLLLLPLIPPSLRVFSNESALCMRWQKKQQIIFPLLTGVASCKLWRGPENGLNRPFKTTWSWE